MGQFKFAVKEEWDNISQLDIQNNPSGGINKRLQETVEYRGVTLSIKNNLT